MDSDEGDDDEDDDDNDDDGDSVDAIKNQPNDCQALSWTSLQFPVCNAVHETTIDSAKDEYLGYVTRIFERQCLRRSSIHHSTSYFLVWFIGTDSFVMYGCFTIQMTCTIEPSLL